MAGVDARVVPKGWAGLGILEQTHGRVHHGEQPPGVVRGIVGKAMTELGKQGPRGQTLRRPAPEADRHRRETMPFEFGRDQAHGLVARRSGGHQQHDIRLVVRQWLQGRAPHLLDDAGGRDDRAGEREVPRSQSAETS
jgi:hypothetical protein